MKNYQAVLIGAGGGIVLGFLVGLLLFKFYRREERDALLGEAEIKAKNAPPQVRDQIIAAADDFARDTPGEYISAAAAGLVMGVGVGAGVVALGGGNPAVICLGILAAAGTYVAVMWYLRSQDEDILKAVLISAEAAPAVQLPAPAAAEMAEDAAVKAPPPRQDASTTRADEERRLHPAAYDVGRRRLEPGATRLQ